MGKNPTSADRNLGQDFAATSSKKRSLGRSRNLDASGIDITGWYLYNIEYSTIEDCYGTFDLNDAYHYYFLYYITIRVKEYILIQCLES